MRKQPIRQLMVLFLAFFITAHAIGAETTTPQTESRGKIDLNENEISLRSVSKFEILTCLK